ALREVRGNDTLERVAFRAELRSRRDQIFDTDLRDHRRNRLRDAVANPRIESIRHDASRIRELGSGQKKSNAEVEPDRNAFLRHDDDRSVALRGAFTLLDVVAAVSMRRQERDVTRHDTYTTVVFVDAEDQPP